MAGLRDHRRTFAGLILVLALLLAVPPLIRMWRFRSAGRRALYEDVAAYLGDASLPTDRIAVPEGARGHFRALDTRPIPTHLDASELTALLKTERPAYCLALNSIAWDEVRAQPWFRDHYQPVYTGRDAYDTVTPLTLYLYRPTPFDRGPWIPQDLVFTDGGAVAVELEAVRVSETRIVPGEPLYVTLRWGPRRPDDPPVNVALQIWDRADGALWDLAVGDRGQDEYVLTPPDDAPVGRYTLDAVLTLPNGQPLRPTGADEGSIRSSVSLVTLRHPPDVSREPMEPDHSLRADFGTRISLRGYDLPAWSPPGGAVRIALYWHARQTPTDDIKVFVHVQDGDGRLLAQSDGKPVYWFYPTVAWQAGETIRDVHVLALPASASRDNAQVYVGMYRVADGVRLPIAGAPEGRADNGRLHLGELRIR